MSEIQPFPLSQLNTCAPRQVLPKIAGTLVSIYKRHEGENDKGPWSVQDIEIEGQGAKVKVKVWNKPEIDRNRQGQHIEIMANEGQAGLTALFVEDDTYDGKTTRILRLTKTAIVQIGGSQPANNQPPAETGGNGFPDAPENQPQGNVGRMNEPAARPDPPRQQSAPDPVNEAKKELGKLANLHILATLTVEKVIAPKFKEATGREMPEDRRGASVSSLIIAGEKRGLHLNLPSKPISI